MHKKALATLLRKSDPTRLPQEYQKNLSGFNYGGAGGWLLQPQMSNEVLRCATDPTDLAGMMNNVNISSGSTIFPIDNARMSLALGM